MLLDYDQIDAYLESAAGERDAAPLTQTEDAPESGGPSSGCPNCTDCLDCFACPSYANCPDRLDGPDSTPADPYHGSGTFNRPDCLYGPDSTPADPFCGPSTSDVQGADLFVVTMGTYAESRNSAYLHLLRALAQFGRLPKPLADAVEYLIYINI